MKTSRSFRPLRSWNRSLLMGGLAIAAFLASAILGVRAFLLNRVQTIRISAGHTTGAPVLEWMSLSGALPGTNVRAIPVATGGTIDMLEGIERGTLDFALIQGGFAIGKYRHVRQVAGLTIVPLVLLVKPSSPVPRIEEIAALRGRRINLGSGTHTGTFWLSRELLSFAGLPPESYQPTALHLDALMNEVEPDKLPDAIFLITEPPSRLIEHLTRDLHYQFVSLPLGQAFREGAMTPALPTPDEGMIVRREHIPDTGIPAYAYGVTPPVPPSDIKTVGSRLLLVARDSTPPDVVARVLETLLESRYAKAVQPPLDKGIVRLLPEAPWHAGSTAFRDRDQPLITAELVDFLSNMFQILIPFCGGLLFLRGWFVNRAAAGREAHFDKYLALVNELEMLGSEWIRTGRLDTEAFEKLDLELSSIKDQALQQLAITRIEAGSMASILMAHIRDTRASLSNHVKKSTP